MKKKLIISLTTAATVATIGVSVAAFSQANQETTPKRFAPEKIQVKEHINLPNSNTPAPSSEAAPVSEPAESAAPAPSSPAPQPSQAPAPATPTFNSQEDMMVYLGIPASEQPLAKMMTQPSMWSRTKMTLTPECRATYFAALTCFNTYVKNTYGTWTAANAARTADPNQRW